MKVKSAYKEHCGTHILNPRTGVGFTVTVISQKLLQCEAR